jgi:hypothetical protein
MICAEEAEPFGGRCAPGACERTGIDHDTMLTPPRRASGSPRRGLAFRARGRTGLVRR